MLTFCFGLEQSNSTIVYKIIFFFERLEIKDGEKELRRSREICHREFRKPQAARPTDNKYRLQA